ncbi:MAG: hypothetical protein ACLP4V_09230, partial [Methylocella sp.]
EEIVGYWTNITERKQAEERAAQARKQEFERGKMLGSSDRNIAVGAVLAALIVSSGMTITGLTVFVVSCILGFIVIWLVVKSGKY